MNREEIKRACSTGVGKWIGGHNVALITIATTFREGKRKGRNEERRQRKTGGEMRMEE